MMGTPSEDPKQPYPDIRSAFTLTLLAMLAAAFTGVAFIDFGLLAALGIGQAIGVGAVATMGAKRVAEPQAERLGLRALDLKSIPTILCLAPAVFLVSELDNFAADWSAGQIELESEEIREDSYALDIAADGDVGVGIGSEVEVQNSIDDEPPSAELEAELQAPLINPDDPWSLLSAFVVLVGISPVVEEFLFRGVIQQDRKSVV